MARLARTVVTRVPHYVTQRGNGGARTFFGDEDYAFYKELLRVPVIVRSTDFHIAVTAPHIAVRPAPNELHAPIVGD